VGMEDQTITVQEIFKFEISHIEQDGCIVGQLEPTGIMPTFSERFTQAGISIESIIPTLGGWG
jgi:pilus assembly protein CpaF